MPKQLRGRVLRFIPNRPKPDPLAGFDAAGREHAEINLDSALFYCQKGDGDINGCANYIAAIERLNGKPLTPAARRAIANALASHFERGYRDGLHEASTPRQAAPGRKI